MNELRGNLREEFHDKEYRHAYAEESLNTYIATQIQVLREQRHLTQKQLADLSGLVHQPRIAALEDINYSSWSINTLRKLAEAFDLRLSVKFETFSSLIPEIETFSRESLQRPSFDDDAWFHKKDARSTGSAILRDAYAGEQEDVALGRKGARVLAMPEQIFHIPQFKLGSGAAVAAGAR